MDENRLNENRLDENWVHAFIGIRFTPINNQSQTHHMSMVARRVLVRNVDCFPRRIAEGATGPRGLD